MSAKLLIPPPGVPLYVSAYVPTWHEPDVHEKTYWQLLGHRRGEPRPKRRRMFYVLNGEVHVSPENFKLWNLGARATATPTPRKGT